MDFEKHLEKYLDKKQISELMNSLEKPSLHGALLNTNKMSDEAFISLFPNVNKHPFVEHAFIYDKNEYELGKSIYYELGCFYLQEPSAMMPSFLLKPNGNDNVLDLCAAPGGKTVQASLLMNGNGTIIANDIARDRALIILENIEKMGLKNIVITNNDFSKIYQNYLDYFSKIILDAPCSGSGMFRKAIEMKEDWSFNKVIKFAEIQKDLILKAYKMLAPNGTMVYSTCSFSYEEDEEVIEYLLKNTDANEISIDDNRMFFKSSKSNHGIHLFPNLFQGEGHYICLIKKPGIENIQKNKNVQSDNFSIENKNNTDTIRFGDTKFYLKGTIRNKGLNIIRYGVKYSTIKGHDEIYDFHLSRTITNYVDSVEINDNELTKYLKGESLPLKTKKGMVLVKYKNIPVSFGKSDGSIIKNHYPKHLRNRF
ncbi:MAG: NOL1/NOP2/sun family putative RNA methylase [Erysipelotrichaceae bacterium]|nr:NOL1/NOP2/sun family putative RNA methylase [Erysipelotrichaceae bacterium]